MKRNPVFFRAESRLGLINIPHGSDELNIGVEKGPEEVLSDSFLKNYPLSKVYKYAFPIPEFISKDRYFNQIANHTSKFARLINAHKDNNRTQIVIGGDHGVSFPSLIALSKIINPEDVGIIMFDSHADIHTIHTSPSGNFHGMWLRTIVDQIGIDEIDSLIKNKYFLDNLIIIGNLVTEKGEKAFIKKRNIKIISSNNAESNKIKFLKQVKNFINQYKHIHVTFDIDVFNSSIVKATGILNDNGLLLKHVEPFINIIQNHPSISIDLVEVNPQKKEAEKTIQIAQNILNRLLR